MSPGYPNLIAFILALSLVFGVASFFYYRSLKNNAASASNGKTQWRHVSILTWVVIPLLCFVYSFFHFANRAQTIIDRRVSTTLPTWAGQSLANARNSAATPAWLNADEHFLIADVYPSPEAAARGLAAEHAEHLAKVTADRASLPEAIDVAHFDSINTAPAADTYAQIIHKRFPDISVHRRPVGATQIAKSGVMVTIMQKPAPTQSKTEWIGRKAVKMRSRGEVEATLTGPGGTSKLTAEYQDKRWVENFSAAANAHHPDVQLLFAHSQKPALRSEEAITMAKQDATSQLVKLLRPRVQKMNADSFWSKKDVDLTQTRHFSRYVELELTDKLIVDGFVQKFIRPDGDVYRAALLVSADDAAIREAGRDYYQMYVRAQRGRWALGGTLALLAVTIGVLYVFLNFATKGYYTIALRIATTVIVIGIVACAFAFL